MMRGSGMCERLRSLALAGAAPKSSAAALAERACGSVSARVAAGVGRRIPATGGGVSFSSAAGAVPAADTAAGVGSRQPQPQQQQHHRRSERRKPDREERLAHEQRLEDEFYEMFSASAADPQLLRRVDHRARIAGVPAINAHLKVLLESGMDLVIPTLWEAYRNAGWPTSSSSSSPAAGTGASSTDGDSVARRRRRLANFQAANVLGQQRSPQHQQQQHQQRRKRRWGSFEPSHPACENLGEGIYDLHVDILEARRDPRQYFRCTPRIPLLQPNARTLKLLTLATARAGHGGLRAAIDLLAPPTDGAGTSKTTSNVEAERPTLADMNSVLASSRLGRVVDLQDAFETFEDLLPRMGLEPDAQTYAEMISVLATGQATDFMDLYWEQYLEKFVPAGDASGSATLYEWDVVADAYVSGCLGNGRTGAALAAIVAADSAGATEGAGGAWVRTVLSVALDVGDLATAMVCVERILDAQPKEDSRQSPFTLGEISGLLELCSKELDHEASDVAWREGLKAWSNLAEDNGVEVDRASDGGLESDAVLAFAAPSDLDARALACIAIGDARPAFETYLRRLRLFPEDASYIHSDLARAISRGTSPMVSRCFEVLKDIFIETGTGEERKASAAHFLSAFNVLIVACANYMEEALAQDIFEAMPHFGIEPNTETINGLLSCCERTMNGEAAVGFLSLAAQRGVELNMTSHLILLSTLCRCGNLHGASNHLVELERLAQDARAQLEDPSWATVVSSMTAEERERMDSLSRTARMPTRQQYAVVARCAARRGKFDDARELASLARMRCGTRGPVRNASKHTSIDLLEKYIDKQEYSFSGSSREDESDGWVKSAPWRPA